MSAPTEERPDARRSIDPDWRWVDDPDTPARYITQLADALWRHEQAENWATLDALVWAAKAVGGDEDARADLDANPAWQLRASSPPVGEAR